jgi:rhodanese-related sulfurtransferase
MTDPARPLSRRAFVAAGFFVVVGGAAAVFSPDTAPPKDDFLSPAAALAAAARGDITLIDIRRPDEWARTGVADGATPLDMRRPDFETELLALIQGERDAPVAFICARGNRSAALIAQLAAAGFSGLIDIPEGMQGSRAGPGWLARDLPVQRP